MTVDLVKAVKVNAMVEAAAATKRAEKHLALAREHLAEVVPNEHGLYPNRGIARTCIAAAREHLNNALADLNQQPQTWPTSDDYVSIS